MDLNENHEKIVKVIQENGPRLPVQIARDLGMNSLFVSAFLSEMVNEKRIKVSHLKVGGSPLYFLEGQEEQLEPYHKYLHPREGDAFLMLKKNKILKDTEQEPSIRVALRSIRDFSFGFKKNDEIYWRYFLVSENEVKNILEPEVQIKKELEVEKISEIKNKNEVVEKKDIKPKSNEFQNPLIVKEKEKIKKEKPKSEFVLRVINFLENENFKIIEEKDYKTKEYNCVVEISSDLGAIKFLTQAKDKKNISESDLRKLLSSAQSLPLPALMLYNNEISKKSIEFAEKYASVLKIKKIVSKI